MNDTTIDGRIDIIIFSNGGKEIIGRIESEPKISESYYIKDIKNFVSKHQNLEHPTKYTCYYKVLNGKIKTSWTDYAGEIERPEENNIEMKDYDI